MGPPLWGVCVRVCIFPVTIIFSHTGYKMSENNHRKQSLTYGQRLESGPVRQKPCAPCWSQWPWEARKQRWMAGLPYLRSEVPSTKSTWFLIGPGFYRPLSPPWEAYTWKQRPYSWTHNLPCSQGFPLQLQPNLTIKIIPGLKSSPTLGSRKGAVWWLWSAVWGDRRISTHSEVKAARR